MCVKTNRTILRLVAIALMIAVTENIAAQQNQNEETEKHMKVRFQAKLLDFCLGSLYDGGFMGIQSGIRAEAFLAKGNIIPEIQYNHGWYDVQRASFGNKDLKPFSDIRIGVRIGKIKEDGAVWRNLNCIDRTEKSGNIITTWYENEKVYGKLHVGFAGGLYMSRAFLGKPFTKESGVEGSVALNTQSVYGGIAVTKMKDNELKNYKSGNTCRWDKYTQYYVHALLAINHSLGDNYYYGGLPYPVAGSSGYNGYPDQQKNLREFRSYGIVAGFEDGRMRKGFVGNYEAGFIPSLKGNGFFFKVGANIAIGI